MAKLSLMRFLPPLASYIRPAGDFTKYSVKWFAFCAMRSSWSFSVSLRAFILRARCGGCMMLETCDSLRLWRNCLRSSLLSDRAIKLLDSFALSYWEGGSGMPGVRISPSVARRLSNALCMSFCCTNVLSASVIVFRFALMIVLFPFCLTMGRITCFYSAVAVVVWFALLLSV